MRKLFFVLSFLVGFMGFAVAKPLVTLSIPAQQFFMQKIAGDTLQTNVLLPPNVDEHNFEFKPSIMKKLEKSDMYFSAGLEFEKVWLPRFKQNYKNLVVVDTHEGIALQNMPHHEHGHGHKHGGHGHAKHDEHEHGHGHGGHGHAKHDEHGHNEHEHEGHGHGHHRTHFEDSEVKDRPLTDWEGEYRSVYPYLLDGSLDEVFRAKAKEDAQKDFKAYKDYYTKGYKSDIDRIVIKGDTITFYRGKQSMSATYAYRGYEILTYESGNKGVRYQFESTQSGNAPKYIQFSDHIIAPQKSDHFHLYLGNTSFKALLGELENWPTFYLARFSKAEIIEDMIAHGGKHSHGELDTHTWLDPILVKQQSSTMAKALIKKYPQHKALYEKNLQAFHQELDALHADITNQLKDLRIRKFIVYHPSWGYFAKRYNLEQIPIEIEGKEPKPADIAKIIQTAKENNIKVIFVQPGFSKKSAQVIAKECGAEVVEVDHLSADWKNELLKSVQKIAASMR